MTNGSVTAILLAGGAGARFGGGIPKQVLDVADIPMMAHSLEVFEACELVDSVIVVMAGGGDDIGVATYCSKVVSVAGGGLTRQASLNEGLVCLPGETEIVVVHDAARPMLGVSLLSEVIDAVQPPHQGAIPALRLEDALKEVSMEGEVLGSKARGGLWRAQTPQAFLREPLEESLAKADAEGHEADDCSDLLVRAGFRVKVIAGDPANIKVTTRGDLEVAEALLRNRRRR